MNQLFFITIGLMLLSYIILKVRNKKFAERESLIWVFSGSIVFLLSVFPEILSLLSQFLGVAYGPTALFLMTFFAIVIILLRKEEQISQINDKLKELSQNYALLEEKLRQIKNE